MEDDRAQISPVDRFLALERSTDAMTILSRFWSSEILSKSAVFDQIHHLPAPFRAMLTLQANNGRSRPARVCARCYGAASHSLKGLAFNRLSRLGQGHPGTCALAVCSIHVIAALWGAWAIVSTSTLKNALLKS